MSCDPCEPAQAPPPPSRPVPPNSIGAEADHHISWLVAKLEVDAHAAPEQVELVERAAGIYERQTVMRAGTAVPLDRCCACGEECWSAVGAHARPSDPQRAGITVPWIGAGYSDSKICVVAINHHNFGGLGANWWMARGHIHERLGRGRRHPFALGIGSYVAAVKASITGRPIPAGPTPAEAADGWDTAAFVEAVKCAPWEKASKPTAAMWRNCPPRFLLAELELLAPRVVIVAGRGPGRGAIADALAVDTRRAHGQSFERGRGRLEGQPIDVLFCNHPGRPVNFTPSYRALHESLISQPLQAR